MFYILKYVQNFHLGNICTYYICLCIQNSYNYAAHTVHKCKFIYEIHRQLKAENLMIITVSSVIS